MTSALEASHLALEQGHIPPVPTITNNHDDRTMRDQTGRKFAIEGFQRPADIGSPGPPQNAFGYPRQRVLDIPCADHMSDPRQGRAEHEGLDPPELVLQTIHKLNQKPAIAIHRAADIA